MSKMHAQKNMCWHYSDLEEDILNDIRDCRAVLVFDLSNEGPAFSPSIFSELFGWIENKRLPRGQCVWLQQNTDVEESALLHSVTQAGLLRFVYYDYFLKVIAWMFSRDSPSPILGADAAEPVARAFNLKRKDKLLLCLNATPRLSRVLCVAAIHHHELLDNSLVSFPGMQYVKQSTSTAEVIAFIRANPSLQYLLPSIKTVTQMAELKIDNFIEKGNALVTKIDPSLYERSFFSVVTESDFVDSGITRVTEKSAKAFCMGHPPVIIGNAKSVKCMTNLGFQDWENLFTRSEETAIDRVLRFQLAINEILRQVSSLREDPGLWLGKAKEVGEFNMRHAVNGGFSSRCLHQMDLPAVDLIAGLVHK